MDENYAAQRYTDAECEEEIAYLCRGLLVRMCWTR
jgi:hypothetical protein